MKIINNKNIHVLNYQLKKGQEVNEWGILNTDSQKQNSFFPVQINSGKLKTVLSISLEGYCSLKDYLKMMPLSKKSFLRITSGILKCFAQADILHFDRHSILMEPEYVMIKPADASVKLIYLPADLPEQSGTLNSLLHYMSQNTSFSDLTDSDFLSKYISITQKNESDCLIDMNEYISDLTNSYGTSGKMRRCVRCSAVILSDDICPHCSEKISVQNGSVISEKPVAKIVRLATSEEILLSKSPFRIGKSPVATEYRTENRYVSGIHAEIIKENSQYYIIDRNSTNGTFLNDIRITPSEKYPLKSSDIFTLGNEKFIFKA